MDRDEAPPSLPLAVLTSPIFLAGAYAWGITLGPSLLLALRQLLEPVPALRPAAALLAALVSLAALAAGVAAERRRHPLAPLLGIWGFLAPLLLAWMLLPSAIDIARLDPVRGVLGAGGMALFSLAWGVPDVLRRLVPEDDPRADTSTPLDARDQLPAAARLVAALGVLTVLPLSYFAWRVRDIPRALFGHSLAALASVLVLSAAAEVALGSRQRTVPSVSSRLRRASSALLLLGLLAALGAVSTALPR